MLVKVDLGCVSRKLKSGAQAGTDQGSESGGCGSPVFVGN